MCCVSPISYVEESNRIESSNRGHIHTVLFEIDARAAERYLRVSLAKTGWTVKEASALTHRYTTSASVGSAGEEIQFGSRPTEIHFSGYLQSKLVRKVIVEDTTIKLPKKGTFKVLREDRNERPLGFEIAFAHRLPIVGIASQISSQRAVVDVDPGSSDDKSQNEACEASATSATHVSWEKALGGVANVVKVAREKEYNGGEDGENGVRGSRKG